MENIMVALSQVEHFGTLSWLKNRVYPERRLHNLKTKPKYLSRSCFRRWEEFWKRFYYKTFLALKDVVVNYSEILPLSKQFDHNLLIPSKYGIFLLWFMIHTLNCTLSGEDSTKGHCVSRDRMLSVYGKAGGLQIPQRTSF